MMTYGTQNTHVHVVYTCDAPDVYTYFDGARHFHELKVSTKSFSKVILALSNFIRSAPVTQIEISDQNDEIHQKSKKLKNTKIFAQNAI